MQLTNNGEFFALRKKDQGSSRDYTNSFCIRRASQPEETATSMYIKGKGITIGLLTGQTEYESSDFLVV